MFNKSLTNDALKNIPKSNSLGLEPGTFLEILINSILLNQWVSFSVDIMQYLETFLIVTVGEGYYWHLVRRGQGLC